MRGKDYRYHDWPFHGADATKRAEGMSAIAARKARMAAQVEQSLPTESIASSSSDAAGPSSPRTATGTQREKGMTDGRGGGRARKRGGMGTDGKGRERQSVAADAQFIRKRIKVAAQEAAEASDSQTGNSSEESSDGGEEVMEEEEGAEQVVESIVEAAPCCSTYLPVKEGRRKNWHYNARKGQKGEASLILGLGPSQTLLFVGKARFQVLDGHCTIAGANIHSHHRSILVFSPQNAPLPTLQASSGPPACKAFPDFNFGEKSFSVVLEVRELHKSGIDEIGVACPLVRTGAFSLPLPSAASSGPTLEGFHPILHIAKGLVSSCLPPSWNRALSSMNDISGSMVCMVKGPKRVGKSTFSRYLLNRLLSTRTTRVAYLETDLGQTEFGPPGMVALHLFGSLDSRAQSSASPTIGPSWTLLRYPLRSHFLGDVTPRDDPGTYLAAIEDLVEHFKLHLQTSAIPLIVNTQGWVKGLGANLLSDLERMVSPTHLFDFMHSDGQGEQGSKRRDGPNASPSVVIPLQPAPLSVTRDRGLNAVEARTLNLVSYFYSTNLPGPAQGQTADEESERPRWDFSTALVQQRPYVVDVREGLQAGLFTLSKGASVEERLQLMALNGSCVAIVCTGQDGSGGQEGDAETSAWSVALSSKQMPLLSECHCVALAIVRSIDVDNAKVHLLTPLPLHQLSASLEPTSRLGLVKGAIEVPIWLSLNFQLIESSQSNNHHSTAAPPLLEGVPLADVPYLDFEAGNEGSDQQVVGLGKRRVRRNILRRSQG